jgi:hypothetical protein
LISRGLLHNCHALTCTNLRWPARTARWPSGESARRCTWQPRRRGKNGGMGANRPENKHRRGVLTRPCPPTSAKSSGLRSGD